MSTSPNNSRRGGYQVLGQKPGFPWSRWQVATRVKDRQSGVLLPIETKTLSGTARSQLVAHLRVADRHLQPLEAATAGEQTLVFSALPLGRSLCEQWNPDRPLPPLQVCKLGLAITQSLAALHQQSIVHGAVRTDRIWVTKEGLIILLRDPAIDLANQGRPGDRDWLDQRDEAGLYAAPEFANNHQASDQATDIYSLGCLLYQLVSGRPPVLAMSFDQAVVEHAGTSPQELVLALQEGKSGDPLLRVIAYAMAKDRNVRFQSADQFAAALRAILPLLSDVVQATPAASDAGAVNRPSVAPVATDASPLVGAKSRKTRSLKRQRPVILVAGLAVAAAILVIGMIASRSGSTAGQGQTLQPVPVQVDPRESTASNAVAEPVTNERVSNETADKPQADSYRLTDDDRLLYAPPYRSDSASVSLALLPPGPAAIVSIRPSFLREATDGTTLADAYEAEISGLLDRLSARCGLPIESIRRCTIAMHPASDGEIEASLAVETEQPVPIQSLLDRWQATASRTASGLTIYAGDDIDGDAYYLPMSETETDTVSRFAIGTVERISEVAEGQGSEILLSRRLASLWDHASAEADIVAMATPNFLFADGRALLQSSVPQAIEPLKSFLIPDVSVGLLVVCFEADRLYAETRLTPGGGVNEARLMKRLQESVQRWPDWADQFLIESQPDPSWRLLAARLPLMMRFFANHCRFGTSDGSAVGNFYLPRRVVPQLSVAVSLALNSPRAGGLAPSIQASRETGLTLDQTLERKMSISFDQESLEFAIDTVVDEFRQRLPEGTEMPAIRIVGADLQKMGITQNQQIRAVRKARCVAAVSVDRSGDSGEPRSHGHGARRSQASPDLGCRR